MSNAIPQSISSADAPKPGETAFDQGATLSMLAQILDSMVEGVSISDEEGVIRYTNPAEDRIFGYERGELVGQHVTVQNTYPPEENQRIVNEVIEKLKSEGHWAGEFSNRKKDGTPFTTLARITAIEQDGRRYWVCVQEDITRWKAAQEMLRVRVSQQAAVARLGQRALTLTDLTELMSETTQMVVDTLGVEYCKVLEVLPDGHSLLLRAGVGWQEGLVGSATVGADLNSQAGYTLVSSAPVIVDDLRVEKRFSGPTLLHQHGVISGMSVIIEGREGPFGVIGTHSARHRLFTEDDVNFLRAVANVLAAAIERNKVEEELRAARDQLSVILEGVADGITVQNHTGRLIYANEAAVKMVGYRTQAELLGAPPGELLSRFDLLDEHNQPLSAMDLPGRFALRGEEPPSTVIGWRVKQTGEVHWSIVRAAPVKNEHGEVQMAVNIFRDVTERVEMERRKDEFVALASHELKTPITSLKLFAQGLIRRFQRAEDNPLAVEAVRQLERMDDQLDRLTDLVRELLDVSKIEAGKLTYTMEETDLREVVHEAVEELQRVADRHAIELRALAAIKVIADRERIKQVLTNLITNAIKYSPQGDRIVVGVEQSLSSSGKREAMLWVRDYGIGIPKSAQARVFERFYQVERDGSQENDTYPGLGLGLYISSEIVARHGGKIWVDSEPGDGATFYFTLPVSDMAHGS